MLAYSDAELFLKAVGEENRLKIIAYLTIDSFCVCEFVELLDMSQPSISQHLKRLRDVDIVFEKKKGKWTFYSLNRKHKLYTLLLHLVSTLPPLIENIQLLQKDGKRILCE